MEHSVQQSQLKSHFHFRVIPTLNNLKMRSKIVVKVILSTLYTLGIQQLHLVDSLKMVQY